MKSLRYELFIAVALAAALFFTPSRAFAQHADFNIQVGPSKRFLSDGSLASSGNLGGLVQLQAHVALAPMLRLGVYVDEEYAPTGEPSSRYITSFGARLKFGAPWPRPNLHIWVFAGFGYSLVYSGGYSQQVAVPSGSSLVNDTFTTNAAGGSFFEIPVGLGLGYRYTKTLEFLCELSGRIGFGMNGSYYDSTGRPGIATPENLQIGVIPGDDTFGLFFTVGLGFDI